ncbi:MAG: class B sortase [Eubacteriales bacterium]|nr:class B sortase [Eubacteriales bacterium]
MPERRNTKEDMLNASFRQTPLDKPSSAPSKIVKHSFPPTVMQPGQLYGAGWLAPPSAPSSSPNLAQKQGVVDASSGPRNDLPAYLKKPSAITSPVPPAPQPVDGHNGEPFHVSISHPQQETKMAAPVQHVPIVYSGFETDSLPQSAELPEPEPSDFFYSEQNTGFAQHDPAFGVPAYELFDLDQEEPQGENPWQGAAPSPVYIPPQPTESIRMPMASKPPVAENARGTAKKGAASSDKPPIRWSRVAALLAAVGMLLFCGIVGGKLIYQMATNEQSFQSAKELYEKKNGSSMLEAASKVNLPPVGVTFAPTATPVPTDPPLVIASASINSDTEPTGEANPEAETQPQRTRLSRYPNNSLSNTLDSMKSVVAEYPDVVARLVIPDLLDEMVVQKNNTYYLTHNYRGALSEGGAIFLDESCSLKTPPENLLLRGQGNVAGKAFSCLWQYQTGDKTFITKASRATLTTLYEEAQYVLLAVIVTDSDPQSDHYFNYAGHPTFTTDEEMLAHVQEAKGKSLYQFTTDICAEDRLLTLATVSSAGNSQCMVLLFRMLRDGESF